MHEARPSAAHQFGEVEIALQLVEKRIDGVAQTLDVIEDEGDLLEMGHALYGRDASGNCVEAIAVGRDGGGGWQ